MPGNGKDNANGQANAGGGATAGTGDSKLPSTAQQAPGILKGTGIANRSDQAAAHARNLEKNPHYATSGGTGGGAGGDTSAPGTASNQDNFLYYYHPDHLGSSSYVTDAIGKVYEHLEYFPFGETWVQESSNTQRTPYLFTAKELDEETGLYYFGARYYDPRVSVWQSPDPILEKYLPPAMQESTDGIRLLLPTVKTPLAQFDLPGLGGALNSKNLGLYSYAGGNPIYYKDPDGRVIMSHLGGVMRNTTLDQAATYGSAGNAAAGAGLAVAAAGGAAGATVAAAPLAGSALTATGGAVIRAGALVKQNAAAIGEATELIARTASLVTAITNSTPMPTNSPANNPKAFVQAAKEASSKPKPLPGVLGKVLGILVPFIGLTLEPPAPPAPQQEAK